jgi:putative tryptophan/tyrosine transport system substrate-binding protein
VNRRDLIMFLGAPVVRSGGALAQQQPKTWRIGILTPRAQRRLPAGDVFSTAFVTGMRDLSYREGKNLIVEWRYAAGDYKRLAGFAAELVALNLPVIVTYGTAAAKALKAATRTVPIVVAASVDLVGAGLSTVWRGLAVT